MEGETKKYSPQRLKDYALWYYFRYYPSNKKLVQKLKEKGSTEDAESIFSDISHLLQENEIVKAKIDNYIFRNKNYRYIRQKMAEKLFPKDTVEKYLEKYTESGKSILDESFLRKKIESYIAKGKSRYYIFQTLGETREDREVLEVLLEEYFIEGEHENILKEYEKIVQKLTPNPSLVKRGEISTKEKQKVIQKLLEKGFGYDEVKRNIFT